MQFSITTEVDAPPEVVFAVLNEVESWPDWTPTVTRVERLGDAGAPLALGDRLRIVQPKVPPAEWTPELREFAEAWRRMPKWVVSRSLKSVGPNATLVADGVEALVRKLKDGKGGEMSVSGTARLHGGLGLGSLARRKRS